MSSSVRQVAIKVSFLSVPKNESLDFSESISGQWRKAPPEGNVFSFYQKYLECIEEATLWKYLSSQTVLRTRWLTQARSTAFQCLTWGRVDHLPNVVLYSQRMFMAELNFHSFLFLYYDNPCSFSKIELALTGRRGLWTLIRLPG